jgi:hypothetical protein
MDQALLASGRGTTGMAMVGGMGFDISMGSAALWKESPLSALSLLLGFERG